MSAFVVDASVAARWFFPESSWDRAAALRGPDKELFAPRLLLIEMTYLLCKRVKGGQCDQTTAERILAALQAAPIGWDDGSESGLRALRLAREIDCPAWDAFYLAMAIERGCPVVTADRKFRQTMKASRYGAHVFWIDDVR